MSIKLAIIDGTGEWRNKTYAKSMAGSFCKELESLPGQGNQSYYQRGPSALGLEDAGLMFSAMDWLKARRAEDASARLMLAGYSRGASTVMAVAEKLGGEGFGIEAMFLFDAVSRQVLLYGRDIVPTVKFCAHAMRSDDEDLVDKYESYAVNTSIRGHAIKIVNPFATNKTRPWFGHVGETAPSGVDFHLKRFRGSHGALGGTGWKDVPEDVPCQQAVATWMNSMLQSQGVPPILKSNPPSSV